MLSTLLSADRRALRRALVLFAGASALAACNSDAPFAPSTDVAATASAPTGTNAAVFGKATARVRWMVKGSHGVLLGGTVFTHHFPGDSAAIADNSAADLDKTLGKFEIEVVPSAWGVCPLSAPTGWVFPYPSCTGIGTQPGQVVDLGTYTLNPEFSAFWWTHNHFQLVGPATYTVKLKSKTMRFMTTVVDEGMNDIKPEMGALWVTLPVAGDYEVCQTKAAPLTELADPACRTITVKYADPANAGTFWVQPILGS
jgi:hypothetical protein